MAFPEPTAQGHCLSALAVATLFYPGFPLYCAQGIDLLAALVHRRKTNAALATELVRQSRRHNLAGAERERLCRWGLRNPVLPASVVKALSVLVALGSPALDRSLEADANIASDTLALVRLNCVAPPQAVSEAWREYVVGECERSRRPADAADALDRHARDIASSGLAALGTAVADSGLLLALSKPAAPLHPSGALARREALSESTKAVLSRGELERQAGIASTDFAQKAAVEEEKVDEVNDGEDEHEPPPPYVQVETPRVATLAFGGDLGSLSVLRLVDGLNAAVSPRGLLYSPFSFKVCA